MPLASPRSRAAASDETPRSEDYLEAVYNLIQSKGFATTSDISSNLEVRPPTVTGMVRKLAEKGYLEYHRYQAVKLTPEGARLAKSVIKRHRVISELVSMIGVEAKTAYIDTEGIEHHVHPDTLRRLEGLAEYLHANPKVLKEIRGFVENSRAGSTEQKRNPRRSSR